MKYTVDVQVGYTVVVEAGSQGDAMGQAQMKVGAGEVRPTHSEILNIEEGDKSKLYGQKR